MSFGFTNQNVFHPVKSKGGIILIIILCILAIGFGYATYYATYISISTSLNKAIFVYFIDIAFAGFFVFLLYGFYGMKYILTNEALIIKSGFIKKIIPYLDIVNIESFKGKTFKYHTLGQRGGLSVPGYYWGTYIFHGNGERIYVSSYVTSKKDLMLIQKENGTNYGISPENEDLFYDSIKKACSGANSQANSQVNSFNNIKIDKF